MDTLACMALGSHLFCLSVGRFDILGNLEMNIANNITELVGNTPLVRLNRINEGTESNIVVKLEFYTNQYRLTIGLFVRIITNS